MLLNETKRFTVPLEKIIVLNKLIDWISVTFLSILASKVRGEEEEEGEKKKKQTRGQKQREETGHIMESFSRNDR